jgi:hypothetical protein
MLKRENGTVSISSGVVCTGLGVEAVVVVGELTGVQVGDCWEVTASIVGDAGGALSSTCPDWQPAARPLKTSTVINILRIVYPSSLMIEYSIRNLGTSWILEVI